MKSFNLHMAESIAHFMGEADSPESLVTLVFERAQIQFNRERNAVSEIQRAMVRGLRGGMDKEPRDWNPEVDDRKRPSKGLYAEESAKYNMAAHVKRAV